MTATHNAILKSDRRGRLRYSNEQKSALVEAYQTSWCARRSRVIHMKDPLSVIREMLRVLVPGGLIVLAEPNNVATHFNTIELRRPINELLRIFEFRMICEHGSDKFERVPIPIVRLNLLAAFVAARIKVLIDGFL